MKNSRPDLKSILLVVCLLTPATSLAIPPVGSEVSKIPKVSGISTWQVLDERRLVLSLSPQRNYLLTLTRNCHTLPFASQLGVSASNNTVYAGFDYITADGERCTIKAINRLNHKQKRDLTKV